MQCECAIFSSVACAALQCFPHYFIDDTIFEKVIGREMCVFWFAVQILSETFAILRRTERDMIKNVYLSSYKIPVIHAIF